MDTQLKCPHCGNNAFQLLKGSDVLECLSCGRSSVFTIASALQQAPTEVTELSE
jgi:transcription elongation factor Elf1